jgi:hypothetical protein
VGVELLLEIDAIEVALINRKREGAAWHRSKI